MGYGWELQAGALLVVENGEFRFRDKIKLTDEGGSVTDTYTFDAMLSAEKTISVIRPP